LSAEEYRARPDVVDEAEVALVAGFALPERLRTARSLRWIQTMGSGVNTLLVPEIVAREELVVTNARGIHAQPIAEHAFGFILMFARNLHLARIAQPRGAWNSAPYRETLRRLPGSTLGVLGLGAIGRRIAELGRAFGMKVIGVRRGQGEVEGVDHVYGP